MVDEVLRLRTSVDVAESLANTRKLEEAIKRTADASNKASASAGKAAEQAKKQFAPLNKEIESFAKGLTGSLGAVGRIVSALGPVGRVAGAVGGTMALSAIQAHKLAEELHELHNVARQLGVSSRDL